MPKPSVSGLGGRQPRVEVITHVLDERHLELEVRVPLAVELKEQVPEPLLQVWRPQGGSEAAASCGLAFEWERLQSGHVGGASLIARAALCAGGARNSGRLSVIPRCFQLISDSRPLR